MNYEGGVDASLRLSDALWAIGYRTPCGLWAILVMNYE